MTYIIDGHNLIPFLPGLSLQDMDDEQGLIHWLQAFARQKHRQVEVYFDGAPPGHAARGSFGRVAAHFVRQGTTADEAIRHHLKRLGSAARNWTVVSSDHQVQAEARQAHAQVVSSAEFAHLLIELSRTPEPGRSGRESLSEDEIRRWLALFGDDPGQE